MTDSTASYEPAAARRRRRVTLAVAVACAAASTGGLLASTFIKSPQQARAEASPPQPSVITAPVERRVLASTLVTRGMVVPATTIEVTPVVAGAGAQVVTAVATTVGAPVKPGQVLVAVSGRPLIALPGPVPAYRDLKPGDSGGDVLQLQRALRTLGHYRGGDPAGTFGPSTKDAVRRLYTKAGYDTPDTGGPGGRADQPALTAASDAVDSAQQAMDALKRRIAAGEQPGPAEEPFSRQLARLQEQLRRARAARADLFAHTGPQMPLAEFVFVPTFPAHVAALSAGIGDPVKAPLVTLAVGELAVSVKLTAAQAALVRPGMPVQLVSETLGAQKDATVTSVGELTADDTDRGGAPFRPALVTPAATLPAAWTGLDVRVTIVSARTVAPVLVVPLSAVSAGADGATTVSVLGPDGRITRVEVRAGVSGDGFVEVSPVAADGLAEGDHVVVTAQS